jgi:hypothetical protein
LFFQPSSDSAQQLDDVPDQQLDEGSANIPEPKRFKSMKETEPSRQLPPIKGSRVVWRFLCICSYSPTEDAPIGCRSNSSKFAKMKSSSSDEIS